MSTAEVQFAFNQFDIVHEHMYDDSIHKSMSQVLIKYNKILPKL